MCLACLEYIKGNLKLSEFKSAVRETVRFDRSKHTEEIQAIVYDHEGDEQTLKDKIEQIQNSSNHIK